MDVPVTALSWLAASALLLLILLVIFGYHVYHRSRVRALLGDSTDVAALAARKEMLQEDVAKLREWIEEHKEEILKLEGDRRQQEVVRGELAQEEQALAAKRQENQDLFAEVGSLEHQRHLKRQALDQLEQKIGDLEAKKEEATALNQQLEKLRGEVESMKAQAGRSAELEAKHAALSRQIDLLEQDVAVHKQVLEPLKNEKRKLEEEATALIRKLETLRHEMDSMEAQVGRQAGRLAELEAKHAALSTRTYLLEQDIVAHKQELKPLREEKIKTEDGLAKARLAAATMNTERETLQQEINGHQREIADLNAHKAALSRDVEKLRGELRGTDVGTDTDAPYADLLQVEPACLSKDEFATAVKGNDESALLQQFRDTLRRDGYFFSERVIDAFHTSLKCHDINPLTVLAGVSGTGKTLLPIQYAKFMGMQQLVIAVQPRWDSPQDMFGFYNYLEKKYKASELSRSLVRMDPYNYPDDFKDNSWAHERMLLILLDEMNLARTEYYFSEFLSKLELRRMVDDPSKPVKRNQAELELDAGPGSRRFKVWVPENIFFVGTMNEDETTQTLSDKVLDRSNVLRFGKPDEKPQQTSQATSLSKHESYLPYATWKSWHHSPEENDWLKEEVNRWIGDLNEALDGIGRPFGFRVRQAISAYVANYPRTNDDSRYKLAFADQIEQKIIPKLRGLDMNEGACNNTLNKIASQIRTLGDDPLEDAFRKAQEESRALGMFHWRGVTRSIVEDA